MPATFDAFIRSWPFDPWLLGTLGCTAFLYLRGWVILRSRDPRRWTLLRLLAFQGGLLAIYLALGSPIEPFSTLLLQVHMVQHFLLMMLAPPLLWLGAPLFPLLRALPVSIRSVWIGPIYRSTGLRRALAGLTHPMAAGAIFVTMTWLWHLPSLYELALRSPCWHYVQHACFLAGGLLFWHPVVRPYPARPTWSLWLLVPLLLVADVSNTVLSALLSFSSTVVYPYYTHMPPLAGSPLEDQAAAGMIMWVPGSLIFLGPLLGLGVWLLFGQDAQRVEPLQPPTPRLALPMVSPRRRRPVFDLLDLPWLGSLLRWRHARWLLQTPLLLLAALMIWDGLAGPQVGPMNLAGVLPWIHWRGLLILGFLVAGNVFCLGCPFLIPRSLARLLWNPTRRWPRWLRNKWLAVVLLGLFLWAYEAFALWDSPWLTAWIALAYFAGALVVDGLFQGAAFCKYVCPIGQFNFVQSLVSPWEIKVIDHDVCSRCRTKDCIKGRDAIPGCELNLYQPRKSGNLDCTFCLDCIHACPHDNVGILPVSPAVELWRDSQRSGIGRWSWRVDLAVLAVLLVFGAFANAAGMVEPVVEAMSRWTSNQLLAVTVFYIMALVAAPLALVAGCTVLGKTWAGLAETSSGVLARFAMALVPLGVGMWLTHYSFHFLTSYETIIPVAERFLADHGLISDTTPTWISSCCKPVTANLLHLELIFLEVGLLLSLYATYRIATSITPRWVRAGLPWAALEVSLFVLGVWIVYQPMQMRGVMQ